MSNEHLDRLENAPEDGGREQSLKVVFVSSAERAGRLGESLWHLTPNERAGLEAFYVPGSASACPQY